ncbi:hypothetical protein GCK32_014987, partial [Trichostrongylus colubriformis]
NEPASDKRVILLNDGDHDDCANERLSQTVFDIAKEWKKTGSEALVLYIATARKSSQEEMSKIATSNDSIVYVDNFKVY